jgi:UDP-2,3-diacylglucosamine pyrophosphatase LpxH
LVIHGDQFDNVELHAAWLSKLGSVGYDFLLWTDRLVNRVRRALGLQAWRLSAGIKARIKRVVSFLSGFEQRLAEHARANGCDGVVCGHIHTPALVQRDELTYCNTGDWVENCSALLEFDDGELRLVRFCPGTGTIAHHESRVPSPAPVIAATRAESDPALAELRA